MVANVIGDVIGSVILHISHPQRRLSHARADKESLDPRCRGEDTCRDDGDDYARPSKLPPTEHNCEDRQDGKVGAARCDKDQIRQEKTARAANSSALLQACIRSKSQARQRRAKAHRRNIVLCAISSLTGTPNIALWRGHARSGSKANSQDRNSKSAAEAKKPQSTHWPRSDRRNCASRSGRSSASDEIRRAPQRDRTNQLRPKTCPSGREQPEKNW